MTAVGLGQQGSQAVGPAKYFYDFTDICQKFHSNGSHDPMGWTTSS